MKRLAIIGTAVLLLAGAAPGAFAHDFWDQWNGKPWNRGDAGSTFQAWDFSIDPVNPVAVENPYGPPQVSFGNSQYPDVVPGPDGPPINTWHLGISDPATGLEEPGIIDLFLPNNPMNNPVKLVYVQITSDKGTLANQPPLVNPQAAGISSPGPIIKHGSTSWYTYNWLIEIRPNPESERLSFTFPYSTNVSQIVVDTICTVPEPSSLTALAPGLVAGLAVVRRRRRR